MPLPLLLFFVAGSVAYGVVSIREQVKQKIEFHEKNKNYMLRDGWKAVDSCLQGANSLSLSDDEAGQVCLAVFIQATDERAWRRYQ